MQGEVLGFWLHLVFADVLNRWHCDIQQVANGQNVLWRFSYLKSSTLHAREEKMLNRKCLMNEHHPELSSALSVFVSIRGKEEILIVSV